MDVGSLKLRVFQSSSYVSQPSNLILIEILINISLLLYALTVHIMHKILLHITSHATLVRQGIIRN